MQEATNNSPRCDRCLINRATSTSDKKKKLSNFHGALYLSYNVIETDVHIHKDSYFMVDFMLVLWQDILLEVLL